MKNHKNSIKYGDIFQLGNHILACGDARDSKLIKCAVGDREVKSAICDVPYGIAITESKKGFGNLSKDKDVANDHIQSDEEYRKFTKEWLGAITPHLERKNSFYIFNADKMIFALREGMQDAGLKFSQLLIWVKTHAVIGRMDYAPQHELIAYGWHGVHEFVKAKDKSVIVHPRPNKSPHHPTTKPIPLIRHLILNSTRIEDVVYDGFLGSGTTLLACEQVKRKCTGVELDPEYCQTTISRWEKQTNQKAKKL